MRIISVYSRIISLAPSNTEILYALGAHDSIVGVTRYCDYPAEARSKPHVGGWLDIKMERIAELKPDLIMTSTFVQDKVKEQLQSEGYEVFHVDPITLGDVLQSIKDIGKKIGTKEKAFGLIEKMEREISAIEKESKHFHLSPKIYAEEWHKPPTVCGNWVPDLLAIAGAAGLCEKGIHSRTVSDEEVINFNPDIIILTWCGFGEKAKLEWVKQRKGWDEIKAIRKNELHVFNDSLLNRPGPRLVEGLKRLEEIVKKYQNGK